MKLIYLWIEKYKNIKNQGFNFSHDFECNFDEKCNSIFPNNINITNIVGVNGSSKSNNII
jgi:hypothetical protein